MDNEYNSWTSMDGTLQSCAARFDNFFPTQNSIFSPQYRTILMTLICYVVNPKNNAKQKVRIFLDNGSEIQLIQTQMARYLGLTGPNITLMVGVSGGRIERKNNQMAVRYCLESLNGKFRTEPILGATIPVISNSLKRIDVQPRDYKHLKNIKTFTEKYPLEHESEIHILCGLPNLLFLIKGAPIMPKEYDLAVPCAQDTKLGTALVGGNGFSCNPIVKVHTLTMAQDPIEAKFDIYQNPDGHCCENSDPQDHFCEFNLQKFWDLEHLGLVETDSKLSLDEEIAWNLVEKGTHFNTKEKRWYTSMPWKSDRKIPYDNLSKSIAVCHRIFQKYSKDNIKMDLMNKSYDAFLEKGFSKVIAEIPVQNSINLRKLLIEKAKNPNFHVLETHPVFRDSASTPCRICLNAASLGPTNRSLNSYLYSGPCLLPQLLHVLILFRCRRYGFAMDVEKLFLQIKLQQEDRPFMQYCQKIKDKNNTEKIKFMQFSSVPFGIVTSPFLASYVLSRHIDRFRDQYKTGARFLRHIYVDDLITSADTLETAQTACAEIFEMMNLGSFPTHKWISNHPSVLSKIPVEKRANVSENSQHFAKVLGVRWSVLEDTLEINLAENIPKYAADATFTKRKILRDISSVFDPCGWVSPFILIGKLLMQELWKMECKWDQELKDETIISKFKCWLSNLEFLRNFKIPRCIVPEKQAVIALAIFADASSTSFGACAYAITSDAENNSATMTSSLIMSKTRVNPTKSPPTIPRAELLALLTAVRIGFYLEKAFEDQEKQIKIFYFSDSEICLYRLQRPVGQYKIFTAHRLLEIHEKSKNSEGVYFCPTAQNPADLASRGAPIQQLQSSRLWLEGPDFLLKQPFEFKKITPPKPMSETQKLQIDSVDIKKKVPTFHVAQIQEVELLSKLVTDISCWNKCRRIFAFIKRFIKNCRDRGKIRTFLPKKLLEIQNCECHSKCERRCLGRCHGKKETTFFHKELKFQVRKTCRCHTKKRQENIYSEIITKLEYLNMPQILESEKCFYRMAQRDLYNSEVAILKLEKELPKHHELIKALPYFDNEDELIKVNSRLRASDLLSVYGNPILLPKDHLVTERVIQFHHEQLFHCSLEQTLSAMRRSVWCMGGKRKVKSVLHGCLCKRNYDVTPNVMKILPRYRIDNLEAFSYIHLDFFGPYKCWVQGNKNEPQLSSVFGVIYSCAQSRCLQIDLIPDLSTDTFLYSLRQLFARRGRCRQIHSDNAKTYKLASKILKRVLSQMNWTKIEKISAEKFEFHWSWSENLAPHENALAEAPIKHVKRAIQMMLGAVKVTTFLELQTICMESEMILNDRPLATMLDGSDSVQPITPSELACGRRMFLLPMEKEIPTNAPFSRKWATRKKALYCFWRRFTKDYLLDQSLTKYWNRKSNLAKFLKPGLRVILRDKNVAFKQWRNAIVTKLKPSDDGVVRRLELKVINPGGKPSLVTRPIQLVSLYERDCPNACICLK